MSYLPKIHRQPKTKAGTGKPRDTSLIGQRFGDLHVVGYYGRDKAWKTVYRCLCHACGRMFARRSDRIGPKGTPNCGCVTGRSVHLTKYLDEQPPTEIPESRPKEAFVPALDAEALRKAETLSARQMRAKGERWGVIAEYLECTIEEAKARIQTTATP